MPHSNKKCELINSIRENNPDIIALTEIYPKHATFETSAALFNIETYATFLTPEAEGRGIAIVKGSIKATQLTVESYSKEFLWCKINLKDQNVMASKSLRFNGKSLKFKKYVEVRHRP